MDISNLILLLILISAIICNSTASANDNGNDSDRRQQNSKAEELSLCLKSEGGPELLGRRENSKEYQNLNYQWNTKQGIIQPLAYILPKNSKKVQIAIKCGRKLNIKMVPKSGGHSYEKYSFGDRAKVVIDLRRLTFVAIDPKTKTASVGAGMLMGPLYWKLWNSTSGKFGIPGTNCPTAGIGGVALGGGLGFWSKRFGLTSDNVLDFEFVDPQGQLLVVSEKTNPDLFWALRGSCGGNFGIVTTFKFRIRDVSNFLVMNIELSYDPSMFTKVFKSWQSFNHKIREKKMYTQLTLLRDRILVIIVDVNMSPIHASSLLEYFPKFGTVGNTSTISWMNFIEFVTHTSDIKIQNPEDLSSVVRKDNPRISFRAKSYYASKLLTDAEIQILNPILSKVPDGIFIEFDSYGGVINRVPSAATAFVHRNSLYCVQVGIETPSSDQSAADLEWINRLDAALIKTLDNGESYQNYIDAELPYPTYLKRYYGSNLARLVEIKIKIDPDNYFEFDQSIPLVCP